MEKKYLTIQQAARLIGVTELTLRNWDKAGKFAAARHPMNNYRVYTLDQIESLVAKLGHPRVSRKLFIKVLEDNDETQNPA
ncbi:MAG: MerR family DNA-binding transcriptional regulator [Patescibacteria group bacterium]